MSTGFFTDKDDQNIGNTFIYKSSFVNLALRTSAVGVTAAVDVTTPAATTFTFSALAELTADDVLNGGYILMQNDNGAGMIFEIADSTFATLVLTCDITDSYFNTDETANLTTGNYTVTVLWAKSYMGELDAEVNVNLGTSYTMIKSRTPKKIWKTYETDTDPKINFDLLSNEKTLAKVMYKLEQIESSNFYARNSDASPNEYCVFIEDVTFSDDTTRQWIFPRILFNSGLDFNISAAGDPPVYPQEGMIQIDSTLGTEIIREEQA